MKKDKLESFAGKQKHLKNIKLSDINQTYSLNITVSPKESKYKVGRK